MKAGKLSRDLQAHVVQALACFDGPSEIAAGLLADHGVIISPQGIECYDPTKKAGAGLSRRWSEIFFATRDKFLKETALVGISHRAVRLRALDRLARRAENEGNLALTAQILAQAAKEVGDAYT